MVHYITLPMPNCKEEEEKKRKRMNRNAAGEIVYVLVFYSFFSFNVVLL